MKSYEETTKAILRKLDTEKKLHTHRKNVILRTSAAAACCALIMGVAVLSQSRAPETDIPIGAPSSLPEPQVGGDEIYSDYIVDEVEDVCLWSYAGKSVTGDLREWLLTHQDSDEEVKAYVCVLPHDRAITFGGVTLGQLQDEYAEQWLLLQKLGALAKEGEDLRFGDGLCTTGNAEGTIWAKELYEERILYYGEDFLSKYIQNGEFLSEKVAEDISTHERKMEEIKDQVDLLCISYCNYIVDWLKDQGCSVAVEGGRIVISVTENQFKNLSNKENGNLTFRMYVPQKEDAADDQTFRSYSPDYVIN